jgi:hypothetical protein
MTRDEANALVDAYAHAHAVVLETRPTDGRASCLRRVRAARRRLLEALLSQPDCRMGPEPIVDEQA